MKKLLAVTAAVAVVAMAGISFAAPPQDATVTVNATVTGTCQVVSAPTIALTLDPSSGAAASDSGNISLWCTNGTTYTISDIDDSDGTHVTTLDGIAATPTDGETIPLEITYNTTGIGEGKSTQVNSWVTAKVLNADFVDAIAGAYTKVVTLTVSP